MGGKKEKEKEKEESAKSSSSSSSSKQDKGKGKGKEKESDHQSGSSSGGGESSQCRPCAFLLGIPFAALGLLLSFLGLAFWIVGTLISCICPCSSCFVILVNIALCLTKAPLRILRWFIDRIPC